MSSETPRPETAADELSSQLHRARETISGSPDLLRSGITEQLDRTLALLGGDAEEAAAEVLDRLGGSTTVEKRILAELAVEIPLANADGFLPAHRQVMRALEILDRDGTREPRLPRLGPLTPVVGVGVEFVAAYITKSYAATVASRLRDLYTRRETQCPPGSDARPLYRNVRTEMDRVTPGFSGGGRGAPLLLAGGISAPLLATGARYFGAIEWASRWVSLGVVAVAFLLLLVITAIMFAGAGVAHRRARLVLEAPLARLYAAIGHAGTPPKDNSVEVATLAVVLTVVAWVVLPALGTILYFAF